MAMTKKIEYRLPDLFAKDLKKLHKKFQTLYEDLEVAKRNAIELLHLKNIDNQSIVQIPGFYHNRFLIYKIRKFACKSLKGRGAMSGIRVIYVYDAKQMIVWFIEIYFKSDQENEDTKRIGNFLLQYCD